MKKKTKDTKTFTEQYISSDTDSSDFIINLNRATTKYDNKIEIEMIKEKRKRRKASEDNEKDIMSSIKNERVLGGNAITNDFVQESSSKAYYGKEGMNTTTHQTKHNHFAPTLTIGQKTTIFHERITGEFIKQKHVLYRNNNTSKNARNRIESNHKHAFTAQFINNQNIFNTQSNRKYISTYTDAYTSNTYCKTSRNQDQYNITKLVPSANHSKISSCKMSKYMNDSQSKKESYPQNHSPGEL